MEVQRFDHVHIKFSNLDEDTEAFEKIVGGPFIPDIDFTDDYGMCAAFCPHPKGLELMRVTDSGKEMGAIYAKEPDGVFAISYKVESLDEAVVDMAAQGYKMMMRYEFGDIKEALFDTKKVLGVYLEMIEYEGDDIAAVDNAL